MKYTVTVVSVRDVEVSADSPQEACAKSLQIEPWARAKIARVTKIRPDGELPYDVMSECCSCGEHLIIGLTRASGHMGPMGAIGKKWYCSECWESKKQREGE